MALRVWLPLTGTLENKGISGAIATSAGTITVDDGGKIGKCYKIGAAPGSIVLPVNIMQTFTTACSIAFWIKINTWNTKYATVFQHGNAGTAWTAYKFGVMRNNDNKLRLAISDGSNNFYTTSTDNLTLGIWYHIVFTYTTGKCACYVNGSFVRENTTTVVPNFAGATATRIGAYNASGGYQTDIYLNDFRIYDHCLSALEVKEISQGLVLHYKLSGFNNGIRNYISNSKLYFYSDSTDVPFREQLWGRALVGGATSTNFKNEFLRITAPSTRNNTTQSGIQLQKVQIWAKYPHMENSFPFLETLQTGDKISFSVETKANDFYRIRPYIIIENADGSLTKNFVSSESEGGNYWLYNNSNNLNNWNKYTYTLEITQDLGDKISSDSIIRLLFVFIITTIPNVSTAGVEINMDVRNLQLELSDTAHNWSPSFEDLGIDTTKIIDSSGYGNNGIAYNNLTEVIDDTSRYGIAFNFNNANKNYINITNQNVKVKDEITVSWWGYMENWGNYARAISCTQGGGYCFQKSGGNMRFAFGVGKTSNTYEYVDGTTPLTSMTPGWHHFVGTFDGLKGCFYYDGILQTERVISSEKIPLFYHASNPIVIGAEAQTGLTPTTPYYNGKLSDIRIYSTALSAEDIVALYNTPAQIDNLGSMHGFEFKENESISIKKNGQILENEINEIDFNTNAQFMKQTNNIIANNFIEK